MLLLMKKILIVSHQPLLSNSIDNFFNGSQNKHYLNAITSYKTSALFNVSFKCKEWHQIFFHDPEGNVIEVDQENDCSKNSPVTPHTPVESPTKTLCDTDSKKKVAKDAEPKLQHIFNTSKVKNSKERAVET